MRLLELQEPGRESDPETLEELRGVLRAARRLAIRLRGEAAPPPGAGDGGFLV